MVLLVFVFAARVDHRAVAVEPCDRLRGGNMHDVHLSSFFNSGQTLFKMVGCAAAMGWMRSLWNSCAASGASAMPLSKNGTSAALLARATWPKVAAKWPA